MGAHGMKASSILQVHVGLRSNRLRLTHWQVCDHRCGILNPGLTLPPLRPCTHPPNPSPLHPSESLSHLHPVHQRVRAVVEVKDGH